MIHLVSGLLTPGPAADDAQAATYGCPDSCAAKGSTDSGTQQRPNRPTAKNLTLSTRILCIVPSIGIASCGRLRIGNAAIRHRYKNTSHPCQPKHCLIYQFYVLRSFIRFNFARVWTPNPSPKHNDTYFDQRSVLSLLNSATDEGVDQAKIGVIKFGRESEPHSWRPEVRTA